MINRDGCKVASFNPAVIIESNDRYLTIARSDLSAVVYDALGGAAELLLGHTLQYLDDDGEPVRVTFEGGSLQCAASTIAPASRLAMENRMGEPLHSHPRTATSRIKPANTAIPAQHKEPESGTPPAARPAPGCPKPQDHRKFRFRPSPNQIGGSRLRCPVGGTLNGTRSPGLPISA